MPRFYDVDADGLPQRWIQMIRETVAGLGPEGAGLADGARLRDQPVRAGGGVAPARSTRAAGGAAALADWKQQVRAGLAGVAVDHVE